MATVARPGVQPAQRTLLTRMVRVMFPHDRFPDGPYQRTADAILEAAAEDVRLRAQLDQGLRDLDAAGGAPFEGLSDEQALDVLRGMSSTAFFEAVRARRPVVEDAVFGLRAAGPALLANQSYFEGRPIGWDPETMTRTPVVNHQ